MAVKHIDLDALKREVFENFREAREDPEAFSAWEERRGERATPVPMDTPVPKPPPLNDDGSEAEEADAQENWLVIPDDLTDLLEKKEGPKFTGEITDSLGRRVRFVDGKRVKGAGRDGRETFRARLAGQKITVISHDTDNNLVSVQLPGGDVRVVHADELDLGRGDAKSSMYAPDPSATDPETGLADRARVGVPGMSAPPPPQIIGRLPNLDANQRRVESRFADAYLKDPDRMVGKYLGALRKGAVGEAPNIFATDDVKALNRDWNPGDRSSKSAMARYNAAVHQTANAVAKRAFVKYLDDVVAKLPRSRRTVLVTNGGCGAGKGSTLRRAKDQTDPHYGMVPAADQVGAVWDAAGEQCATENEWVLRECQKRGIEPIFAYVWADPATTWDSPDRGVMRRAMRKGRMVDARLFADSYALGAKNMSAFAKKHPEAKFIWVDNREKGAPKLLDSFPAETLEWSANDIYRKAVASVHRHRAELSPAIITGALGGAKIWGPP